MLALTTDEERLVAKWGSNEELHFTGLLAEAHDRISGRVLIFRRE